MTAAGPRDLVLVDTSAWIDFFSRTGSRTLKARLRRLLDGDNVATTGPVVLELLQGCRSEPEREQLERYFRTATGTRPAPWPSGSGVAASR